jgi:aspartyl-tRNA(Asn)/glutamyl-tRNA(Gln) amidotransferase subunit B
MNYETVIGIELHCELKTKTKMFSSAPTSFAQLPNSCTNEIDLGHPGTLPCLNKKAVELALRACLATHCEIDQLVKFDRKNYYYPDLPKGFQITQQFHPLGKRGYVEIQTEQGIKKIRLNRIHMEEDTAKQFHQGEFTYLDFNRAGTPLVEIVSEADMRSGKEAADYVEQVRNILCYLDVSDGKMEEGSLRCDTNVSIRPVGSTTLGTKTEIKNLNSLANIQKAVDYESKRQAELLDKGEKVIQATLRFDEPTQSTVMMRKKEGNVDYKFFPEPNIFPIKLEDSWIEDIKRNLPELPAQRVKRYEEEYHLSAYNISILVANKSLSDFFDAAMKYNTEPTIAANYLMGEVLGALNGKNLTIEQTKLNPEYFGKLVNLIASKKINSKQAKDLLPQLLEGKDPEVLIKQSGISQITDLTEITKIVEKVIAENQQSVADYHAGRDRALGYIVGQVMKQSKGKVNPQIAHDLVLAQIDKLK